MTMAGTADGKLHPVAKWSLIIGPILVVVFNFLLPTNGFSPLNPEDSGPYIAKLGEDLDLVNIYLVLILLGLVLYTRAIIGLWQAAPAGRAKQRLMVGMLGAVAALSFWGVVLGLGLAEASVAEKSNTALAAVAASGGAPEAVAAATAAGTIARTLHAGFFGVFQIATYVAYISLIPIGGGIAVSGIVRKEFGWLIVAIGVVTLIVTSVMPIKTENGIVAFGIIAAVWGLTFLVMGLQIMRQEMNGSTVSTAPTE